jgi:isopenicillin N synthase-like dioxygenase
MDAQPPVIDITGLREGSGAALERVAQELIEPCATWGAFHVVGHGVSGAELERFDAAMRAFFDLPEAEKRTARRSRENARGWYDEELTKNRPDWKEVFDYGAELRPGETPRHSDGVNQWPAAASPDLREVLLAHFRVCEGVGRALLRALCVGLGAAPDRLDAHFAGHSSFVRLNRYATCPDPAAPDAPHFPESGHLGVHHHTDAGALTVLYQDEVAGLQVFYADRFVVLDPVPGALTINLGDMLQVWSNDRLRSPLHRVLVSTDRVRHSAPFFLNPAYETVAAPLEELIAPGSPARYRPVSWAHFRDQRSAGDYRDYGAEIQIADFRLDA